MKAGPWLVVLSVVAESLAGAAPSGNTDPALFGVGVSRGTTALFFNPREEFVPNGRVRVLAADGQGWRLVAEVEADEHLRPRTVELPAGFRRTLRLEVVPEGAVAHLDTILLAGRPARGLGERLARKLASADNDVVPFSDLADVSLRFGRGTRLTIAARVEPAVLSVQPIVYPTTNTY